MLSAADRALLAALQFLVVERPQFQCDSFTIEACLPQWQGKAWPGGWIYWVGGGPEAGSAGGCTAVGGVGLSSGGVISGASGGMFSAAAGV